MSKLTSFLLAEKASVFIEALVDLCSWVRGGEDKPTDLLLKWAGKYHYDLESNIYRAVDDGELTTYCFPIPTQNGQKTLYDCSAKFTSWTQDGDGIEGLGFGNNVLELDAQKYPKADALDVYAFSQYLMDSIDEDVDQEFLEQLYEDSELDKILNAIELEKECIVYPGKYEVTYNRR